MIEEYCMNNGNSVYSKIDRFIYPSTNNYVFCFYVFIKIKNTNIIIYESGDFNNESSARNDLNRFILTESEGIVKNAIKVAKMRVMT